MHPDNHNTSLPFSHIEYLQEGGEMGELTRSLNWHSTCMGGVENWPQSLLTTLNIILRSKFPMFLWWGIDLIQFYNDAYRPSLGSNGKHPMALGQRGKDCWPEIWPLIKPLIDQVMQGGESIWMEDQLIPIFRNGKLEDVYWTFCYSQVSDGAGKTGGVLVTCQETTQKVITAIRLQKVCDELSERERKFRNIIEQAPVAIAIFTGPEFVIDVFNSKVLEFLGRTASQVKNKPLFVALPEASNQGFEQLLNNVLKTGETFTANEMPVKLERKGILETAWINFIYEPLKNKFGFITGVMVVCVEVTELVKARVKIEEIEERSRLAIEAAELGTFDYNILSGELVASPRLDIMFGVGKHSSHEIYIQAIHPDDREKRKAAFDESLETGNLHYEVRIIKGNIITWVQVHGRIHYDEDKKPARLVGTTLDITRVKASLQEKDDFITIASHELKTPLTSLNANMQLVSMLKGEASMDTLLSLFNKAFKGLAKLNALVENLLTVSKFSHGQLHLNKIKFNLAALVKECCDIIGMVDDKVICTGAKDIEIFADPDKVEQVIINFISNALKYAGDSKQIKVDIEKAGNTVKLSVIDEGPGILPDKLPHLFDRFFRVDNIGNQFSGLRLGLYICSEIIKKHNGQVGVETEIGKGSTFWFTLPFN